MKGNVKSLVDLAKEVESIDKRKKDYLYNSKDIEMGLSGESLSLNNNGNNNNVFKINENTHQQLASKLDIPKKYYDKMQEIPGLRAQNVNAWLFKKNKERYFIRTLDNTARAILSDRFKPVDNYLILSGFLPVLQEIPVQIKSCSLSEKKMYIQIVFPQTKTDIIPGDTVQFGVTLTNSEVGRGSVAISTTIWRLVCSNGMVAENLLKKYHVGRRVGEDIQDYDIYQDDTIQAELTSFKKRLRDVFNYCLKDSYFKNIVQKMRNVTNDKINDVSKTVGEITKKYSFSDKESEKIMMNIGKETGRISINQEPNRWMLANSITAMAHEIEDAEKQYDYEKIGWGIVDMSKSQWNELNKE